MCGDFLKRVKTKPDLLNLHIFQEEASGVMPVIEHYRAYGLKMIITELACINVSYKWLLFWTSYTTHTISNDPM